MDFIIIGCVQKDGSTDLWTNTTEKVLPDIKSGILKMYLDNPDTHGILLVSSVLDLQEGETVYQKGNVAFLVPFKSNKSIIDDYISLLEEVPLKEIYGNFQGCVYFIALQEQDVLIGNMPELFSLFLNKKVSILESVNTQTKELLRNSGWLISEIAPQ